MSAADSYPSRILSSEAEQTLRRLAEDSDAGNLDPIELDRLRGYGFIYTVFDPDTGRTNAHLKKDGRELLGLE